MEDYSRFVPNVHFDLIPIKNLLSNQQYQRNLSQSHIERAAANFDLCQINPVKVSRRNGINYVFNGQHTIEIVALVSGSRDTPVWCMIYDDLSYQNEADIFANQQKYVKPLLPYEVFMANLEAGNDDQLMIRDVVESYGLRISNKRGPGNIVAVSTLENIFRKYGYHVLDRTLRLVIGAWEGDVASFAANVLNATAKLIVVYGDALNDEVFKEKVGAVYRRISDEYLDPMNFNPESLIGIPHIYDVFRKGNVALINAPGNGVADDKGIYYFVPKMIRYYLSEEPILKNAPTYLPFYEEDMQYVLENFDKLVLKDVAEAGGYGVVFGNTMTKQQKEDFIVLLKNEPRRFIAQEIIDFQDLEILDEGEIVPRKADLRAFVLMADEPYVWASGLTRFSRNPDSFIVNSSQGGGFKDTWVLSQ